MADCLFVLCLYCTGKYLHRKGIFCVLYPAFSIFFEDEFNVTTLHVQYLSVCTYRLTHMWLEMWVLAYAVTS